MGNPRNGCDDRLMVKILAMKIQVNLVPNLLEKATQIHLNCHYIKIFIILLLSPPGFHIFFFRTTHFFTAGLFLD